MQVTFPVSPETDLGDPVPLTGPLNGAVALLIQEDDHRILKLVQASPDGFRSATPTFYALDDPRIVGFYPIVGEQTDMKCLADPKVGNSEAVNHLAEPRFRNGQKVRVRHQPDLGECIVENFCDVTDVMTFRNGKMSRVGFYVRLSSPTKKKRGLGYHEDNLVEADDDNHS